jgi:hypothetical protein
MYAAEVSKVISNLRRGNFLIMRIFGNSISTCKTECKINLMAGVDVE